MCLIYSGTVYLQCSGCGVIDRASSRTFLSITQCETYDNNLCSLGLQRLEQHQHLILYDPQGCQQCERARDEQRSIYSILRGDRVIGGRIPLRVRRPETSARHPAQRNTYLNALLSDSAVSARNPSTSMATAFFPPTPPMQQPIMQYPMFQSAPQPQPQNMTFPDPVLGRPPLPDLAEDPDFQEMLNMSTTFAAMPAPAQQGEVEPMPTGDEGSPGHWLDDMPILPEDSDPDL